MAAPKINLEKIKRKKGYTYRLDYRINGKRIREAVGSNKQDAELIRTQRQRDFLLGKFDIPVGKLAPVKLADLVEEFLKDKKNRVRATSLHRYRNYLTRFSNFFVSYFPDPAADISHISGTYINKFIEHALEQDNEIGRKWTPRTTNDAIKLIRSVFKFAVDCVYITDNPFNKIKPVKDKSEARADYFTTEELQNIYKHIDPHWVDAVKFIAHTGLRKGELINLRWESVDLTPEKEQIAVEGYDEWDTKTGKVRVIPLNDEAIAALQRQIGRNSEFVFTSKEGHQIHPDKILHALKKTLEALNLEGDVHKLRHTFASTLAMNGVDMLTIKELLGHADLKTTQIYAHLAPEFLRTAVKKLAS